MAYNIHLADRLRQNFQERKVAFRELKMMGGLCFMVDEKMCTGIVKDDLMARIDPKIHGMALSQKGCREMDFSGRPMKGFVFVGPEGTDLDDDLEYWIELCLDYNPKIKSNKPNKNDLEV